MRISGSQQIPPEPQVLCELSRITPLKTKILNIFCLNWNLLLIMRGFTTILLSVALQTVRCPANFKSLGNTLQEEFSRLWLSFMLGKGFLEQCFLTFCGPGYVFLASIKRKGGHTGLKQLNFCKLIINVLNC